MIWVWVVFLFSSSLLVGLGVLAFWPEWPPIEPGQHRPRGNPAHPAPAREPAPRVGFPIPGTDEWTWSTGETKPHRARHRHEDIGEGTQALHWYERPSGPRPLHPPREPIE